jgi:hypothetical protein
MQALKKCVGNPEPSCSSCIVKLICLYKALITFTACLYMDLPDVNSYGKKFQIFSLELKRTKQILFLMNIFSLCGQITQHFNEIITAYFLKKLKYKRRNDEKNLMPNSIDGLVSPYRLPPLASSWSWRSLPAWTGQKRQLLNKF